MNNKENTELFQPLIQWGPASLVSLTIHALALYLILMLPPLKAPVKRVVQVDAITMTAVTPKPEGGHAGGGAGAPPAPDPPQTAPKPPPPKPPEPKPKPVVKPPPRPAPEPDPIPIPPRLAMPKPAPPLIPPRPAPSSPVSSNSRLSTSSSGSGIDRGSGSGSRTGLGTGSGSGVGPGRGYGSGSGSGTGTGSGAALQGYLAKVRSLLERNKIYPNQARSRNEQGTVVVRFTISSDGSIGGVGLSRSSGHSDLDQAAQETVNRVRRFPPFPSDLQRSSLTVQVPLAFRLQGG